MAGAKYNDEVAEDCFFENVDLFGDASTIKLSEICDSVSRCWDGKLGDGVVEFPSSVATSKPDCDILRPGGGCTTKLGIRECFRESFFFNRGTPVKVGIAVTAS
jgi:hypothetical protein